jgi:hypothetical protein
MEYKVRIAEEIKKGDVITFIAKVNNGWRAKINNSEVIFTCDATTLHRDDRTIDTEHSLKPIEGWILLEQNERWEKQWLFLKRGPYKVGVFRNEQEKTEKCKRGDSFLEDVLDIQENEVIHSERTHNKPISEQPVKFEIRTSNRLINIIVASRDKMNERTRDYAAAFRNRAQTSSEDLPRTSQLTGSHPESQPKTPHFNFTQTPQLATRGPLSFDNARNTQTHEYTNSNGAPSQSKWFNNIKNIVATKSNLNVTKGKGGESPSPPAETFLSAPAPLKASGDISIIGTGNKSSLALPQQNSKNRFIARVHWRDGTYRTVPVTPGITAKEVCELVTKKTKIALFENLFYMYEKFANGEERILDHKTDVYDLILKWGPTSDNQLVCDLNLDTKNTVKNKMQGSLGASYLDDAYDSKYGSLDFDDLGQYPTEDDKGLEMMIQEMVKLKNQLKEEDEMLRALEVEEQQVDMLIARLAQL